MIARMNPMPDRIVVDPQYPYIRERPIRIANYGENPVEITTLSATDARYKLEVTRPSPTDPKLWVVKLTLPEPPYAPPAWGELIRIETDDPQKKTIDVPVMPSLDKPLIPRPDDKPLMLVPVPMPPKS